MRKPERPVLDSRGISDPEGLWLPLRPLVGAGDDNADQRNELLITVMRASGLQVMDKALFGKGSSDPFVEVRCGDEKVKSSTKKKTLSPDWNGEELSVPMLESADSSSELVLTVFDWDRVGSNDFMGRTTVTLGELLQEADERRRPQHVKEQRGVGPHHACARDLALPEQGDPILEPEAWLKAK